MEPQPKPRSLLTGGVVPFLQRWIINTLAVLVATRVVDGIHWVKAYDLFVASLLLGVMNALLRPLLLLLSLPILIVTFGLFTLVINAALLYLVGWLMGENFVVETFWVAFKGALAISLVSLAVNFLLGGSRTRVQVNRTPPPPPPDRPGGPVIDV